MEPLIVQLSYNSLLNLCYLFTSDSVFEYEGAETPPTAAQPAEEGDYPEVNPEGEEGGQQPTQIHSGAGHNSLVYAIFFFAILSFMSSASFVLLNVNTLAGDSFFCFVVIKCLFWPLLQEVSTLPTLPLSRLRGTPPESEQRVSR